MKTPSFVKVNEKDQFEIQLSDKGLTNQSLHSHIEELEQFLRAEGTEKRRIHLDLTHNPGVTDVESDPGEGGFTSLVLFLRSFGSEVTKLEIGGTGIKGDGLLSLLDFVKLGVAEELNFSGLSGVDESTALAVLTAVQECHAYPLNNKLPLVLRMDRIGLEDPKYILAKAFNDVDEWYEVLAEGTPELLAAQAARHMAESNQGEAPDTPVKVSLPFFYSQEPEDDVRTPAPPSPVTPPSTPEKPAKPFLSLQTPEKPVEKPVALQMKLTPKVRPPSPPVESALPRAFLANGPKPPRVGPPPHLVAPKSVLARKPLEAQIQQSTSPKAPPKLPPPPPPRPTAGLRGVLEKVKEHGSSIWKGAQSATDEILSAPAFSAKPTSSEVRKVPSPQQTQQKPEPEKAEDDEKDSWSWWKGHWWDWDSQEKKYIEVEQSDKAHGWAHDPASHDWQNGSWQEHVRDWRPWSWSNEEQFWNSKNDSAEEKKACNSWTQNWPSCQEGGWNGEDWIPLEISPTKLVGSWTATATNCFFVFVERTCFCRETYF